MQSKIPTVRRPSLSAINELIKETNAVDLAIAKTVPSYPKELLNLASHYLSDGSANVSPVDGVLALREIISSIYSTTAGRVFNPETEVTISASTTQAAYTAISAVVKYGDEVIIIEPSSTLYAPAVILNGARPIYVKPPAPLFKVDWDEVRKHITAKTRMIIINSPNNPTGQIFSEDDLLQLQKLINGTNIIILSDETFDGVVFDEVQHHSVLSFEKLAERCFVISSFADSLNINSWGLAYCLASEKLMVEYRKMQQIQLLSVNSPMQHALVDYLPTKFSFDDLVELYQGKRNYFNRLMANSLYQVIPSQGGCYELVDYSKVSDEDDETFAKRLLLDFGIAVVPASYFYHEKPKGKHFRVCIAKENEELERAAEILLGVPSTVDEI